MSRESKQRATILRVVEKAKDHPRADRVYDLARREIPNISMGTVYRNLSFLIKSGKIRQLHVADGTRRYDGNTESHYHFICDGCGIILDLDKPVDYSIGERVAVKTGYKILEKKIELIGLCNICQENSQ